eukprot:1178839-Prorocentrum_minimum.AAC.3
MALHMMYLTRIGSDGLSWPMYARTSSSNSWCWMQSTHGCKSFRIESLRVGSQSRRYITSQSRSIGMHVGAESLREFLPCKTHISLCGRVNHPTAAAGISIRIADKRGRYCCIDIAEIQAGRRQRFIPPLLGVAGPNRVLAIVTLPSPPALTIEAYAPNGSTIPSHITIALALALIHRALDLPWNV